MRRLNISAWAIRTPIPSVILFIVLVLLGAASFRVLPIERFPNIIFLETTKQIKTKGRTKQGKLLTKYLIKDIFLPYYHEWLPIREKIMKENNISNTTTLLCFKLVSDRGVSRMSFRPEGEIFLLQTNMLQISPSGRNDT